MKSSHFFASLAILLFPLAAPRLMAAQPGSVDLTFNADYSFESAFLEGYTSYISSGMQYALALQPDGKILAGGDDFISSVRFDANGGLDLKYDLPSMLYCTAVQGDGKILVGGTSDSYEGDTFLRRLNADGSTDPGFDAKFTASPTHTDRSIRCIALQNDGRILIGGGFTTLAKTIRNRLARLASNGALDPAFNPNVNGLVRSMAVQLDGRIVLAGEFTTVGGTARNHLARLNADGSLDSTFDPNASDIVYTVALQADGKIVIGGGFSTISGVARPGLARLNPDGTPDLNFYSPSLASPCRSIALQTDGQIVFVDLDDQVRRCNSFGQVLLSVAPNGIGQSLGLQADGRIVVGGSFTGIVAAGTFMRNRVARIENDLATQALSVPDAGQVRWLRGGTSPEAQAVTFELSTDGGGTWAALGLASRIAGGWHLTGLTLPAMGTIRARARISTGYCNGSSSLLESVRAFTLPVPPTTPGLSPSVSYVTATSSRFSVTVNPNGSAGSLHFAYGTDPTLAGAAVTPELPFAAGTAGVPFSQTVSGLAPATLYYCTAVVTSDTGSAQGDMVAFTMNGNAGDLWGYQHFGAGWTFIRFTGDEDRDGVTDLAEYAFGGDPLAPDSAAILPQVDVSGGRLRITFTRDPAHDDISLIVQGSSDLQTWTDLARSNLGSATLPLVSGVAVVESALGARQTVQVTDSVLIGTPPARALRVKVSR